MYICIHIKKYREFKGWDYIFSFDHRQYKKMDVTMVTSRVGLWTIALKIALYFYLLQMQP